MTDHTVDAGRRRVLRTVGALGATGALATGASTAAAQSTPDLASWFSNTSNYDGVVDATGKSEVRVTVGAEGNGGAFAFGPAAIRVDPGTTVVWEWTGEGSHNVVAKNGAFESEMSGEQGHTFEHQFTDAGVVRYSCTPHEPMGMKGAVVVGDVSVGASSTSKTASEPNYGGWFENVSNYDGTVDARGQSEVRITVGAEGNGGAFAFDPPAVRVDPGTTVVWEWSGKGGSHNVVDPEAGYESTLQSEEGATYELVFETPGISTYACAPHRAMGMKGAVVVGDAGTAPAISPVVGAVGGGLLAALLSPLAFGAFLAMRGGGRGRRYDRERGRDHPQSTASQSPASTRTGQSRGAD